ncbi:MAG TPA: amidohydrolase family protein [Rhizomicrobium sp.]|nr:amidohydrolase family protein [Rhizomicrobium sp.]
MKVDRRRFCAGAALLAAGRAARADELSIPVIDTHVHLFDATRPQGAPYGGPADYVSHVAKPADYRARAVPLGIVGAIAVEASPWSEDNLWLLETAATDPIIVGVIGNLKPEAPDFAATLDRYRKIPLFRGIRYGNLWGYDIAGQAASPDFIAGLKHLADQGLVLDTANPRIELLEALIRVHDRLPDLSIVIDHLPALDPAPDIQARYDAVLSEMRGRSSIVVKLSEIYHRRNGQVVRDPVAMRARLDQLMDVFGEDRVLFGSDWPNSVGTATLEEIVGFVKSYFATKPRRVAEKYFWMNSARIYQWARRDAGQPDPAGAHP